MKALDVTFDLPNWQQFLQALPNGSSYSAPGFLALMESEPEQDFSDALLLLKEKKILLDVSALPRDFGHGENEVRLRREAQLAESGKLLESLEENDPLRVYLQELAVGNAAQDLQSLADRMMGGEEEAAHLLVSALLPEITRIAYTFAGRGVLLLDLIQEGGLALWEGIGDFDGGDVIAFAEKIALSAMSICVTQQARACGIGEKLRQRAQQYQQEDARLLAALGRNPTKEEIAAALAISQEEADFVEDMLSSAKLLASLNPKEEKLPEEDDQSVEDTAYFHMRQRIQELLSQLDEKQQKLLTLRFGLDGAAPMTPEQTAKHLHMTPEEVIGAEADALAQLRNN